ncbi:MAG: hypothetical protein M0T83_07145 [Nitrospiraceae bacterium]|nr:hypothetical protein [Nitrospiraceae bacterium]
MKSMNWLNFDEVFKDGLDTLDTSQPLYINAMPDSHKYKESVKQVSQTSIVSPDGFQEIVQWDSPVFGRLEGVIFERGENSFTLRHPLTGEEVTLPNEWIVSLDERAAILEHDGGLPREEADDQAKREFFGLFRRGGHNATGI